MGPLLTLVALIAVAPLASPFCDRNLLADYTYYLSGVNIQWPCPATKTIYLQAGRFQAKNVIPTRTQIYKDDAFVLMPRYKSGVPITLGKVDLKWKSCQPEIVPFPCWNQQEEGNCEALQSAVDVFLDAQDLLWVLDAGVVNTLEQPIRRCPPKVVAYHVKTGKLAKTVDLSSLVIPASRLQYLAVDYNHDGQCFLYVSDAATRALLVHDVEHGRGWRIVLPPAVTLDCARRDVLYLALVRKSCGSTFLYFTYLSSPTLFSIKTEFLQSGSATGKVIDVGAKPGNMVFLGTDSGAAIFFRLKGESEIFMWNTENEFKQDHFLVVQKGSECRLATQVMPGFKRLMWVIESNFQDYIHGTQGCAGASVVLHPIVKTCD